MQKNFVEYGQRLEKIIADIKKELKAKPKAEYGSGFGLTRTFCISRSSRRKSP